MFLSLRFYYILEDLIQFLVELLNQYFDISMKNIKKHT